MSNWPTRIGVAGCGAMGRAMAVGLVRADAARASHLTLVDAVPAAVQLAVTETGGHAGRVEGSAGCDLIVLAVKPKDAEAALGHRRRVDEQRRSCSR